MPGRGIPLLLTRFPAILAAVAVSGVVLGAAAGARHLFSSSIDTAALQAAVGDASPLTAGLTVRAEGPVASDRVAFRDRLLTEATGRLEGVGQRILSVVSEEEMEVYVPERPRIDSTVRPATRTRFLDHIEVVEGTPREGWWLAASVAGRLRVGAGDAIRLSVPGPDVDLPVAGVYRDLADLPPSVFWAPLNTYIYRIEDDRFPPPLLLAEQSTLLSLLDHLAPEARLQWEFPVVTQGLSLPAARALADGLESIQARMDDPRLQLGAGFTSHEAGLPALVEKSEETSAALSGPVQGITLAGLLVVLVVFAGTAVYAMNRRAAEYAVFRARGLGPIRLGGRTAVEALLPTAVGCAAGWALAWGLVRSAGPADLLAEDAVRASVRDAAIALAVALSLLGIMVGVSVRGVEQRRRGRIRRVVAGVPWEAAALVLAAASLYEILTRGAAPVGSSPDSPEVDALIPLFPLLFLAGAGGVLVRGLRRLLPRLRAVTRGWGSHWYLAGSRVAAASGPARILMTVCLLAVGLVLYAGSFVASARATAERKSLVFVGSRTSVSVPGPVTLPPTAARSATTVVRIPVATADPGGSSVEVLAVDAASFARAAYWEESFADTPLRGLLERLARQTADGAVPVAVAGGAVPLEPTISFYGREVPATVVASPAVFPGMSGRFPLVVAEASALERALGGDLASYQPSYEVWVDGPPGAVLTALRELGTVPHDVVTASEVRRTPDFVALSWIFGLLLAFGILVGMVAVAGLLLFIQARQRARDVSYALARRMGLTDRTHRRSVALELGVVLGWSFVLGAGLAAVAALLVHRKVDFIPELPPSPVLRLPASLHLAVAGALVLVALGGSWAVHRHAQRSNAAEVMRVAG